MDKFQIGDVVCLVFDKSKRFRVKSPVLVKGKIELEYFDEARYEIVTCEIEPRYLMPAPKQT